MARSAQSSLAQKHAYELDLYVPGIKHRQRNIKCISLLMGRRHSTGSIAGISQQ